MINMLTTESYHAICEEWVERFGGDVIAANNADVITPRFAGVFRLMAKREEEGQKASPHVIFERLLSHYDEMTPREKRQMDWWLGYFTQKDGRYIPAREIIKH